MPISDQISSLESRQFRITMGVVCIAHVLLVIYAIWKGDIAVAVFFAIQALGLYRRVRWAYRMFTCFLWFSMVAGISLMMPARFEGVNMADVEPPSIIMIGTQALVICGIALISLHFFGKCKSLFQPKWF